MDYRSPYNGPGSYHGQDELFFNVSDVVTPFDDTDMLGPGRAGSMAGGTRRDRDDSNEGGGDGEYTTVRPSDIMSALPSMMYQHYEEEDNLLSPNGSSNKDDELESATPSMETLKATLEKNRGKSWHVLSSLVRLQSADEKFMHDLSLKSKSLWHHPLALTKCSSCARPIYLTCYQEHYRKCMAAATAATSSRSATAPPQALTKAAGTAAATILPSATTKEQEPELEQDATAPRFDVDDDDAVETVTEKKKKPKPRKKTELDLDRHCGVITQPNHIPCFRSLSCRSHSVQAKKAVPGRSKPFDTLFELFNASKPPLPLSSSSLPPSHTSSTSTAADTGLASQEEKSRAADMSASSDGGKRSGRATTPKKPKRQRKTATPADPEPETASVFPFKSHHRSLSMSRIENAMHAANNTGPFSTLSTDHAPASEWTFHPDAVLDKLLKKVQLASMYTIQQESTLAQRGAPSVYPAPLRCLTTLYATPTHSGSYRMHFRSAFRQWAASGLLPQHRRLPPPGYPMTTASQTPLSNHPTHFQNASGLASMNFGYQAATSSLPPSTMPLLQQQQGATVESVMSPMALGAASLYAPTTTTTTATLSALQENEPPSGPDSAAATALQSKSAKRKKSTSGDKKESPDMKQQQQQHIKKAKSSVISSDSLSMPDIIF